jgi:hypothetical protein
MRQADRGVERDEKRSAPVRKGQASLATFFLYE